MLVVGVVDLLDTDLCDGDILDTSRFVAAFDFGREGFLRHDVFGVDSHEGPVAVGDQDVVLALALIPDHVERPVTRTELRDGCSLDVVSVCRLWLEKVMLVDTSHQVPPEFSLVGGAGVGYLGRSRVFEVSTPWPRGGFGVKVRVREG